MITFKTLFNIRMNINNIKSFVKIGYKPSHHCKLPDNTSVLNDWIPRQDNLKLSSCSMYVNSSVNNDTMDCLNGWVFDESISGPTIVSKVTNFFSLKIFFFKTCKHEPQSPSSSGTWYVTELIWWTQRRVL